MEMEEWKMEGEKKRKTRTVCSLAGNQTFSFKELTWGDFFYCTIITSIADALRFNLFHICLFFFFFFNNSSSPNHLSFMFPSLIHTAIFLLLLLVLLSFLLYWNYLILDWGNHNVLTKRLMLMLMIGIQTKSKIPS